MVTSPFFSGRIPQDLCDKADEYCKETGKKRTELLIEALSTYLNFPVKTQNTSFVPQPAEVTKEMFEALQQQVNKLERLITQNQSNVITQHEKHYDNNIIVRDNNRLAEVQSADKVDSLGDNNSNGVEVLPKNFDNTTAIDDNSSDNFKAETVDNTSSSDDNSSDNSKIQSGNPDNAITANDNNTDNIQPEQRSFEKIPTAEIPKLTNINQRYSYRLVEKAVETLKKQGKKVQPSKLLEEPLEITYKDGITVNSYPYKLFYCGENTKGKPVWDLLPDDNKHNQNVIKKEENTTLKLFE